MFKGHDKKETVTEVGIFYLCSMFKIQSDMGRELSSQEWVVWTKFLNKEISRRNAILFDWIAKNRPDLIKEGHNKQSYTKPMITGQPKGPSGKILYTPIEVAVICKLYTYERQKNKKMTIDELFDFSKRIVQDIDTLKVDMNQSVSFAEMWTKAANEYKKSVLRSMN